VFSAEQEELLQKLDSYYELRYPRHYDPIETGTDDWASTDGLLEIFWDQMPKELLSVLPKIVLTKKGGRVLMEKKDD
jgi:hypothetical protein